MTVTATTGYKKGKNNNNGNNNINIYYNNKIYLGKIMRSYLNAIIIVSFLRNNY